MKAAFIAVAALLCLGTAMADDDRPADPTSVLFEAPQWAKTRPGATLTYRYARKSADEALLGPSFEDRIRLHIEKGDTDAARTVRVELSGGERRRASGPFEDVSYNPVLMLFLEHHVEQLSRTLHANPRYLKNAIRAALRDKYQIENGETLLDGRSVKTSRVLIVPFVDDPNKVRMRGLDRLVYTFVVSEQVPGQVTELTAKASGLDGAAALEETLTYDDRGD